MVTGPDGLGDKAFNDMHYNGMVEAKKHSKIDFEYIAPTDEDFMKAAETLIKKDCNVIIAGAGFMMIDSVDVLSEKYPDILFILDDAGAKTYRKNVSSVTYMQNEGSFLAGALAALMSESNKIAVFGGGNVSVINDFIVGYKGGAEYIKPDISVEVKYISDYIKPGDDGQSGWSRPDLGQKLANDLYKNENVDVIFHVAGSSGTGGFQAAKENGKYAIGVDSDQDYLAEGFVLTSMMKKVDEAMVFIIGELLNGKLENKNYALGLELNGVSLSEMKYTINKIPKDYIKQLEQIKSDIIEGKIKVPTVF